MSSMRISRASGRAAGFTLVELLAVVAILGVLASIIMALVTGARNSARQTQCLSNMRETAKAALLFAADNKGQFPALYLGSAYGNKGPWSQQLADGGYLPSPPHALTCPVDETALEVTASAATAATAYNKKNTGRSYAYAIPPMQPVSGDANRNIPRILSTVSNPAKSIMLVEFRQSTGQDYRQIAGSFAASDITATGGGLLHGNKMNLAFIDGHVAALSRAEAAESAHWSAQ